MATPANYRIQDQNLNILHNGGKTDVTKTDNKGRISGRKALNDISNSSKPSDFQSNKTDKFTNVISTSAATVNKGGKATEKGKDGGRKPLGNITNSVKRPLQNVPKSSRKLGAVAEGNVPISLVDERFLHDHQECIKAQTKAVDLNFFMKSVGLDSDIPVMPSATINSSSKKKPEETVEHLDMEEMTDPQFDDQILKFCEPEISGNCSPASRSPKSPQLPYMNWEDEYFSDLMVIETPKLMYP